MLGRVDRQIKDRIANSWEDKHMIKCGASESSVWPNSIGWPQGASQMAAPSTYSMTMQRWRRVSKEQNMPTTKGFSANVRMSRSTNACWIWLRRIRFCLLIFFMAKRCRVSRCRTR